MSRRRLKVVTILGTRPEIIRLSCVMPRLDELVDHKIVHTGQNYDPKLNQVFFRELELREPDIHLKVDTSSLGSVYAGVLIGSEKVLREERPDAVLILGDTNSSIAALMARRLHIPVYHMEAGNRSFDLNVPEEINRRVVDHISDFNLVYTERARQHLLAEGISPRRIYLTGSPSTEVLSRYGDKIQMSTAVADLGLAARKYYLVSLHREENVEDADRLAKVLASLETLAEAHGLPLIVSTHPRTREKLTAVGYQDDPSRIRLLKPFGFFDYAKLQSNARCVVSDSGSISEESAILGFPAVTLRDSMERPEALDAGTMMMASTSPPEALQESVETVLAFGREAGRHEIPWEYSITNTSERVVKLIIGTARLSNEWSGIR